MTESQRTIFVKGCEENLCPYCRGNSLADWGRQLICNHPHIDFPDNVLGLDSLDYFGEGHFPSQCPL